MSKSLDELNKIRKVNPLVVSDPHEIMLGNIKYPFVYPRLNTGNSDSNDISFNLIQKRISLIDKVDLITMYLLKHADRIEYIEKKNKKTHICCIM